MNAHVFVRIAAEPQRIAQITYTYLKCKIPNKICKQN